MKERDREMEYADGQLKVRMVLGRMFPKRMRGYQYLIWFFDRIIAGDEVFEFITKTAYPDIARQFQTKPAAVERTIRSAVKSVVPCKLSHQVFGDNIHTSNTKFIECVLLYISQNDLSTISKAFFDFDDVA